MLKSYANYTSIKKKTKHQIPQSQKTTHITDNFFKQKEFL